MTLRGLLRDKSGRSSSSGDIIYQGKVVKIDELDTTGSITVRIPNIDDILPDDNLPFCRPLLSPHIWVRPNIGDVVHILSSNTMIPGYSRLWIGPVGKDYAEFSHKNDIVIHGKGKLKLKLSVDDDNENPNILLNAGESFIDIDDTENSRNIEIGSNFIYLRSDEGSNSDHSVVYGEELVETLRYMMDIINTHKHPPNGPPIPDFIPEMKRRSNSLIETILSKRVKTN